MKCHILPFCHQLGQDLATAFLIPLKRSKSQLAALGPNIVIFNFISYTFTFMSIATTINVSKALAEVCAHLVFTTHATKRFESLMLRNDSNIFPPLCRTLSHGLFLRAPECRWWRWGSSWRRACRTGLVLGHALSPLPCPPGDPRRTTQSGLVELFLARSGSVHWLDVQSRLPCCSRAKCPWLLLVSCDLSVLCVRAGLAHNAMLAMHDGSTVRRGTEHSYPHCLPRGE